MKNIIVFISFMIISGANLLAQQIRPGDGIRLIFFNNSESISGDYYVHDDGFIQLPFLGLVNTTNREFKFIENDIKAGYDSLYKNPEITIQPLFRINVLGEVQKPGLFFVTGVETLSSVIALAGGETTDADLSGLTIIRGEKEIGVQGDELLKSGSTVKDMGLVSGDRIYVPRGWWVAARNTAIIVSGLAVIVTLVGIFIKKP
jgi:polysaccharide export outer membrane protein